MAKVFKARLIEDQDFYRLRRKMLMLSLLPVAPLQVILSCFELTFWWGIAAMVPYALLIYYVANNRKALNAIDSKKIIEVDAEAIRIKHKRHLISEVKLDSADKLILKKDYFLHIEGFDNLKKELKGKTNKNFIIVRENDQSKRFDFEIDSHYMIVQLNKIISSWKQLEKSIEFR